MKRVLKILLKRLASVARPYLRTYGLLQTTKVFNRSALVFEPGAERVVVLAPHMDDEVIGCGGALARHRAKGAAVAVVFLTDGRQGGVLPPGERSTGAADLAATRRNEARTALAEVGITDLVFLDGCDGGLADDAPRLAGVLRTHLARLSPEIVYLPCFLEEHPDHRAASELLRLAVLGTSPAFECFAYEVWTPLFPNCLVPIDAVLDIKKRALGHYRSQLAEADYMHTALGLNAYRSGALLGGTCRHAEAFCALPVGEYLRVFEMYGSTSPSMPAPAQRAAAATHPGGRGIGP